MMQVGNDARFQKYRGWFYGAAVYNLVWGTVVVLFPGFLFRLWRLPQPTEAVYWQVVGMFVLVYAPAYWWAGRRPYRHRHLIVIGLLGKVLGPIGFVWSLAGGQLPLGFLGIIFFNDLIWWPVFFLYLRAVSRQGGGWHALLLGD